MNKRFVLILAAIAAIFVGLIFINKKDAGAPAPSGDQEAGLTNHTFNEGSSGVTVIEYGDFQCPACFAYFPIFEQLKAKYQAEVTFQFRHFPIVSIHQNAMAAHRAAEAAGLQDKFEEMYRLLYERQKSWEASNSASGIFEGYAEELGIDMEQYKRDVNSETVGASIQADLQAGEDIGVSGTPSFVVNGELIETPTTQEAFEKIIDDAVNENQGSPDSEN